MDTVPVVHLHPIVARPIGDIVIVMIGRVRALVADPDLDRVPDIVSRPLPERFSPCVLSSRW